MFNALSGIPALRPNKAARTEAAASGLVNTADRTPGAKLDIKTIVLVVHGVKSTETAGAAQVETVRALAAERGMTVQEVVTERPGHCETLVAEADLSGVDAIGVMGGDGTLREGVSGMLARTANDRCPIFVFPVGTGNNFAGDLGIRSIQDMFAVIDKGATHAVDAVKVTHPLGTTYSINCVTWGLAREAAETAEGWRLLGPLRYDLAGFYHILLDKLNFAKIGASVTVAPAPVPAAHEDYLMMFAQNTRCSGRGFTFCPLAKLDDGMFDLVAVKKSGIFRTIGLFNQVKTDGGHVEDPAVCYLQARTMALTAQDAGDLVNIDGEVNVGTPVTVDACQGAFLTLV
uniref:DAGKc domain-containing protein n=1 Tax=Mantoniella antarctica TaxID=81844 RepID=A0A7S0SSD5_9CHLO